MVFLKKYKILSGEIGYNKWIINKKFTIGNEYVCVGFTKNPGNLQPTIHLINREGMIISMIYSDDRFELLIEDTDDN